jgi:arsenate reductase
MLTVYHNGRCGKSRECLAFLNEAGADFEVVEYLKTPLKASEIKSLLKKLKIKPIDLVRTNEKEWIPFRNANLTDDEIIKALAKFPILMQRPIAVQGEKAIIARSANLISEIL